MYYIYELVNPVTNIPFYVGQTNNPRVRLNQHRYATSGNSNVILADEYIKVMRRGGNEPIMNIIDETDSKAHVDELERYYINEYRMTYNILNVFHMPYMYDDEEYDPVKMCGVDGKYCNRIYECDVCMEHYKTRLKRLLYTVFYESGMDHGYICYVHDDRLDWKRLQKKLARDKVRFIRVPKGEGSSVVFTDSWVKHRDFRFEQIELDDAYDLYTSDEFLFPSYGNRSSSRGWIIGINNKELPY